MRSAYTIAVVLALAAGSASAQTVLRLSNWLPPSHPIVKDMVQPWIDAVAAETDGRVTVRMLDAPLGPPPAHFDLAAQGAADVTFSVHSYTPGRFALTDIAELPFLADSAEALSVAFWRLHEAMLAEKGEHRGVHVLGLFTHGPGMVFTRGRAVSPVETLRGAKIRVAGAMTSQLAEGLGMVSVQAPSTQAFEMLSGGVADGIFFPPESVPFFRLDSLLDTALRAPGGLYNVSFLFVMNEGAWGRLSEEDRAAISRVSGEAFARRAGQAWDAADAAGMEALADRVSFVDATEADLAALRAAAEPIYAGVRARYEERGVDFDAALAMLQAEIAAAMGQ